MRARSADATGGRTRSGRRSVSPSTSTPSTTARSRCGSGIRWPRIGSRSTAWSPTCRSGCDRVRGGARALGGRDRGARRLRGGVPRIDRAAGRLCGALRPLDRGRRGRVGPHEAQVKGFAAVGIAVALTAGCTQEDALTPIPPETPSPSPSLVEVETGPTTALQAMRRLCIPADIVADPVTEVPTPAAIADVADQVEAVRGLAFDRPVNVEPISESEMDRRLGDYFDAYYPKRSYARRSAAWQTIGALPSDVGYLEALDAYQQGQVLGFYNSQNEELVYTGDATLDRIEQFVLAHELTHAIDDQHFDLDRLDGLVGRCQEERFQAALGIVEGSANHFATQVLIRFPIQEVGSIPGDDPGQI